MADVSLTLLVLKSRQVEQLRAFYQTLGVHLVDEQHEFITTEKVSQKNY